MYLNHAYYVYNLLEFCMLKLKKYLIIFNHHYNLSVFQCSPAKQAKRGKGGPAARGLRLSREGPADVHAKCGLPPNATTPAEARRGTSPRE